MFLFAHFSFDILPNISTFIMLWRTQSAFRYFLLMLV